LVKHVLTFHIQAVHYYVAPYFSFKNAAETTRNYFDIGWLWMLYKQLSLAQDCQLKGK